MFNNKNTNVLRHKIIYVCLCLFIYVIIVRYSIIYIYVIGWFLYIQEYDGKSWKTTFLFSFYS